MSDMRKSRPQAGKVHSKASRAILASMVATFSQAGARAHEQLVEKKLAIGEKDTYKPRPGERPTTMPRHPETGEAISEDRRRRRKIKALFAEENGRPMSAKDFKRERRRAELDLPAALEEANSMRSLFRGG